VWWIAIPLALGIRIAFVLIVVGLGKPVASGFREYTTTAHGIIEFGTQVSPFLPDKSSPEPSCIMPPAYGFLVAQIYSLGGPESKLSTAILQIINMISTTLALIFVVLVVREVTGPQSAWLAALLMAFNPLLYFYSGLIWETDLYTLLVTLSTWSAFRLSKGRGKPWLWLGYGLWLGLVALVNPALSIAYPLLTLWSVSGSADSAQANWRPRFGRVTLTLLGFLIALTPWTIRNRVHFGEWMYVRCGFGLQLWLGACPEASAQPSRVLKNRFPLGAPEEKARLIREGETAYLQQCAADARSAIHADRGRYAGLVLIRTAEYWTGIQFTRFDSLREAIPKLGMRTVVVGFITLETFVLILALILRRRIPVELKWIIAIVLVTSLVYCLTYVETRYRAPYEPLMVMIVAMTYGTLRRRSNV